MSIISTAGVWYRTPTEEANELLVIAIILLPQCGLQMRRLVIYKESVEPISFISEEVVVEPWRKWTTSNTPHPYRYDGREAYTAPFTTLVYTRMSVVRASFLHWNYHISSEGQCENTFNMSTELLQHHKFRNYFQITDNTQGIELQNSTIFFVFLSLVEITYRYGIIQTETLRNFRPWASAQTVRWISRTLTAILRQQLWTRWNNLREWKKLH